MNVFNDSDMQQLINLVKNHDSRIEKLEKSVQVGRYKEEAVRCDKRMLKSRKLRIAGIIVIIIPFIGGISNTIFSFFETGDTARILQLTGIVFFIWANINMYTYIRD